MRLTLFQIFFGLVFIAQLSIAQEANLSQYKKSGYKSHGGIRDFFDNMDRERIEQLKFDSNLNVSLQAAWYSFFEVPKSNSKVNQIEFLGFVSGRLNSKIPDWWRQQILGISKGQDGCFSVKPELSTHKVDKLVSTGVITHEINTLIIDASDSLLVVESEGKRYSLKRNLKSNCQLLCSGNLSQAASCMIPSVNLNP